MDSAVRFLWDPFFRDLAIGELMRGTMWATVRATLLSRPTFYHHFKDLRELIQPLLGEVGAAMHRTAPSWIDSAGEPMIGDLL